MNKLKLGLMAGCAVVGAVVFFTTVSGTYYSVDQGERAVVLTNGAISEVSGPGLHFKFPWFQHAVRVNMQTQSVKWEQSKDGDSRLASYSKDQQPAHISLSVTYHFTDPAELYTKFGSGETFEQRVLWTRTPEQLKNVFGRFTAQEAIQDRAKLNAEVVAALQKAVLGTPAVVESVQIEDISFSDQYEKAVEARMTAIVKQQQAEADKQKRMIDADAGKYEKEAQADAALYTATAEAKGITLKGQALRDNPGVVNLTVAQAWDGKLPETMVPGSAVPFIDVAHH